MDAAILFSDLLLPLEPMGIPFDFIKGEGPAIERPIRTGADIDRVEGGRPARCAAIHFRRHSPDQARTGDRVPLDWFRRGAVHIGVICDRGRALEQFRAHQEPDVRRPRRRGIAWPTSLATVVSDYLVAQIEAGVDAVQVFDSWVGALNADDYREFALPHTRRIFRGHLGRGVPTIHFGVATGSILHVMREAGGDVLGADWRIPLDEAWERIGADRGIQGNLDPTLLLGPRERLLSGAPRC